MRRIKKEKRFFRAKGEVENAAYAFEECGWAYSEQQFKAHVRYRLARRFPHLRIYVGWWVVEDITDRRAAEQAAEKKKEEKKKEEEDRQLRLF